MKKNYYLITTLLVVLLNSFSLPIKAQYSHTVLLDVGEEFTYELPYDIKAKNMSSYSWTSHFPLNVDIVKESNESVTVKAVKYTSSTVLVQFECYYTVMEGGRWIYGGRITFDLNVNIRKPGSDPVPDPDPDHPHNPGDRFSYSYSGVTMLYRCISNNPKTCMVGGGSAEDYDKAVSTSFSGSISIPETADGYKVIEVANCAFSSSKNIKSITMPKTITSIGQNSFQDCDGLTSITVPDAVEEIKYGAFSLCDNLSEVTIGSGVKKIGMDVFWGDKKLKTITVLAKEPPTTEWSVSNFESNVYTDAILYVPAGCIEKYKNASIWSKFKNIQKIGGGPDEIKVTKIKLNVSSTIVLLVDMTTQLEATILPDNATNKTVKWSSSNEKIAKVSSTGLVTAISAGNATTGSATGVTITCEATDGSGVSASCIIAVAPKPTILVSSISLDKSSLSLDVNGTYTLKETVLPTNATDKSVTWTSSNTKVATVSDSGLVTAKAAGSATITCKANDDSGVSATCSVTVKALPIPVTKIALNASSASLNVGDTKQLTATITPSNATNKTVTWLSTNTNLATVSSSGLVTAKAAGSTTIFCKANDGSGKYATCSVTIKEPPIPVTKITLNASSASLNVGDTKQLTATITPSNATDKTVTWTSSNTSAVTVSSTGLVTAKAVGSATITCKANDGSGVSATCNITVSTTPSTPEIEFVSITCINKDVNNLTQSDILKLRAVIKNTGTTARIKTRLNLSDRNYTRSLFASNNDEREFLKDKQVTIDYELPLQEVPAGQYGAIIEYYNDWGYYSKYPVWMCGGFDKWVVYVTIKNEFVKKITLNASSTSLNVGDTKQLTATITPSDATNKTITWSSSNTSVATVSSTGLVTAKAAGSATITCKANDGSGVSATCNVTVNGPNTDNYIYIDNVETNPGSQLTLSLKMKNKAKIRGFQFDLYLPSGVTAVKNDKGRIQAALSGRRDSDDEHTLTVSEQADGAIRFLCGSQYDETFTDSDGEVATLTVNIAKTMKEGDYSIILKNIKLTETDISKYYETSEKRTTLTIKDYILGDVNGDGKVDVSDYIGVANRIMGIPQEIFIEKAGDVDVNGVIDVSDYIGVANIIMTGNIYSSSNSREAVPAGGPAKVSSTDVSTISNVIYMPQLTVDKGATTAQLSLHMKNKARIRGFQFDLYLPNGITAAKNNKGRIQASLNKNRLESDDEHTLTVGEQADGAIRFLCGSQYDETFTGSDGEVMTLTVNIASGLASGDYPVTLKNIKLTETDISKYYETESIVGVLTIEGATLTGDVNGDGKVNGTDLVTLARMILGMDSKNGAADVNKDGTVNGTDYTALVNIIMGRSAAVRGAANDASAQMATLHMDPFTISAGETKEMTISLTNRDAALTLLQFDMLLPKGLAVVQADGSYQIDMAGRTNWDSHQLGAYGNAERMRFLLASGSNELIEGAEGAIIRMNVSAAEDFEGGTIKLNDILGVTPNEVEVWMPTSSYTLTGNGTTGIYGIGAATDESVIYDLSGHRQQTMKKGANIVGGKKMIKK